MSPALSAAAVAVEVFCLIFFGPTPLILACLVFCSLMFLVALVMELQS